MESTELSLEDIEDQTRVAIDAVAPYVDELHDEVSTPVDDLALFFKHLPGTKMLDVGCGWSYYVERFVDYGLDYIGIDLSPKMVELSRKMHPTLEFEEMSFRRLQFDDGVFDGLWCCCSLGHEPKRNIQAVLAEMRRVLKPRGLMLIILPYSDYSDEFVAQVHQKVSAEGYCAVWEFNEFLDELMVAGFKNVRSFPRLKSGSSTFLVQK